MVEQLKRKADQRNKSFDWILALILLVALFMYGWKIWDAGNANAFYTSAITSMTESFKNFWYASFDPAGYITVDKPPVALWFMAISAKIFGVHGWSVVLPSVLFGVGSVALINSMVKRHFGRLAGYLAAITLVFTPIFVADSRTNNMDTTLVFFLILSLYLLDKAIQKNKVWLVIVSFGLIGVSFNIKMLQAFMILPAMYLFYWLASNHNWKKKTGILSLSTIALVVFTLIWPLSVDMTSANNRPYEGGSEHNSVMELAFGYNGTQRLLGQTTGTGGAFKGMGNKSKSQSNEQQNGQQPGGQNQMPTNGQHNNNSKLNAGQMNGKNAQGQNGQMQRPSNGGQGGPGGQPGGKMKGRGGPQGGGGGAFNIGTAGPLRLFQSALGPQISWLLIFSIIGLISGMVYYRDEKKKWYQLTKQQKQMILWAGWLVPVAGFFSVASFFHPYYTIMLAPPIATLFGIGFTTMYRQMVDSGPKNWKYYLLPVSVLSTAGLQAWYVSSEYSWLAGAIAVIGFLLTLGLIFFVQSGQRIKPLAIASTILLFIAPVWWSLTPTISGSSSGIPSAGPSLLSSSGGGGGMMNESVNKKMLNYLEKNAGNSKYLFATSSSNSASPYIIQTKKAVMAMGGFNGTDPAMNLTKFKQLVKNGEVKYYYDEGRSSSSNSVVQWIQKNGKKVDSSKYQDTSSNTSNPNSSRQGQGRGGMQGGAPGGMGGNSGTLYDLSSIYSKDK